MSNTLNEFGITHLWHVGLAVPDYDTQRAFYTGIWRLTEVGSDGDLSYLAAGPERVEPMSELIAKESFNDIDRGVFVAPPV